MRFEDRYEILGELGADSFASVYEARQLSTGQLVAIKLLAERQSADLEVARFRRETKICAALSHPNIVGLIDSGVTTSGQLYAVFEHVSGETLAQTLEREGALGVRESLRLMTQVLEALASAHAKGIVHRELRPANLMLSSGGVRRSALVLDFGLRAMATELRRKEWEKLTQSRGFMGTPLYAAPEQLAGEAPTPRSDLFSWGLIFLECLTGRHPIAGKGAMALLLAGGDEVEIPGWLADHRLGELLARVTAHDPERRDVTAAFLIAELEEIVGAELPVASDAPHESALTRSVEQQHTASPPRRLSAIISADVFGYSRLMAADEESTVRTVNAYREEIALRVRQHRGRVVDFTGDNFLAEFSTALEAVQCAEEIQRVLGTLNVRLAAGRRVEFRIGIHLGDVRFDGDRMFGTGVNIAARLEGLAEPGELCISSAVREQLRGKLDLELEDLGERSLKSIPDPVHVFRVRRRVEAAEIPTEAARPPRSRWNMLHRGRLAATLGLGIVLGVAAAAWLYSLYEDVTTTYSIAVLPFTSMSPDEGAEFFARGLSEDILDQLVQREARPVESWGRLPFPIGKLDVASRTASFQLADRGEDLSVTAEELGVAYVLEGSVQRMGGRLHIAAQLVRAEDGFHVWSKSYDRAFADRFETQAGVALNVAHVAASELLADIERRYALWGALGYETSTVAMEHYLNAHDQYRLLALGEGGDWAMREQLLRKALEADPEFYRAWEMLAHSYMTRLGGRMPLQEASNAAHAAINRVLELNPDSTIAYLQLGQIYMNLDLDYRNAEAAFRRGLNRSPARTAWFYAGLAKIALREGRTQEALRLMATASTLDARHEQAWFLNNYAWTLLVAGDFEQALKIATEGMNLRPVGRSRAAALHYQILALLGLGRIEESKPLIAEAWALLGSIDPKPFVLHFAAIGETERARRILADLGSDLGRPAGYLALGDVDNTFKAMEAEIEDQDSRTLDSLRTAEFWDVIRDDPRFDDMLELLDSRETHTEQYLKDHTIED
jgi:class 3 adenylate cyclase/TolB-like protein/Tfp pilus assembly protein PilF